MVVRLLRELRCDHDGGHRHAALGLAVADGRQPGDERRRGLLPDGVFRRVAVGLAVGLLTVADRKKSQF